MNTYLLLLHESTTLDAELSPDDIQSIIAEYSAWHRRMADANRMVDGRKLKDDGGRHLVPAGERLDVIDGPFGEAKEIIGGFFLIRAESYDEAASLCDGSPHLKYGGRIEIRQVDGIDDTD